MPYVHSQPEPPERDLIPGFRFLLRFGAILPLFAAVLVFGLILIRGPKQADSLPLQVQASRQKSPIQLVSAQEQPSDILTQTASAPLKQAPSVATLETEAQPSAEVVRHVENWQPTVKANAEPQSVSQIVSAAEEQWANTTRIRQVQSSEPQGSATGQPEVMRFSLSEIDDLIAGGNYPFAQELLQDAHSHSTSLLKVQIELRMALCAELLAQPKNSLKYYRMVMQSPLSPGLSDAASLSASRVLVDQGRQDLAASILARLLIQREQLMATELRAELMHELASCLTPDSTQESLLHPGGWVIPRTNQSPTALMKSWNSISKDTAEIASPSPALSVRRLTNSADGIYVNCSHSSVSVIGAIQSVAKAARLKLAADDDVIQFLSERTSPIACREFPLDVFMDSLCMPLLIDWSMEEGVLQIQLASTRPKSAKRIERFKIAQRFLRLAVTMAPEHSEASLSYLYLGVTYAELGRVDRAVRYFRTSMEQYPRSNVRAAARFNLGKASLATDRREEALQEFYRTVDHVAGPEIDAAAYMFIGRILMENDLPRDAVTPLARAVAFATGSDQEADAAILLSSAYLMHGQMEAANSVLDQHRGAFQKLEEQATTLSSERRHLRKQAAFISSLARFWGTRGYQRSREGGKLLSSLAGLKLDLMFGQHNAYIVGAAYGVVGMKQQRKEIFEAGVAQRPTFPLQNRMKLILAGESSVDQWLQEDKRSQIFTAEDRRKSVATVPALVRLKSDFSAAERAFRAGEYNECLKRCGGIQQSLETLPEELAGTQSEHAIRRANLQLLGKTHQALGNHALAIRCLAGIVDPAALKTTADTGGSKTINSSSAEEGIKQ